MDKLKSRKLILAIVLIVLATVLLYVNKLTGGEWVSFVQWIAISYSGFNVGQKLIEKQGANSGLNNNN